MKATTIRPNYVILDAQGRSNRVHESRLEEAAHIDSNADGRIGRGEMLDHLQDCHHGCHHHEEEKSDPEALADELQRHLLRQPNPAAAAYHSYEQVGAEFDSLVAQYPDLCQKVSLGKTHEGRDIWALCISDQIASGQPDQRPGGVITGCHHAREWMSVEVPMHVAHSLLDNFATDEDARRRVQSADTWIVPIVNPDGLEHSRNEDSWWRKNRRPVEQDAMGKPTSAIGVDLNRNYYDGNPEHLALYRPDGDTPGSTYDDFGATSDNPRSDTYRGPSGGSEVEVQSLLQLELGQKNIRGVIDHHSYGEMILYPWGHTSEPSPNKDVYVEIGKKLNQAMDNRYSLKQSSGLYPSSGESDDFHNVNGLISFTLEVGRSFQPNPSLIQPTCEMVGRANLAFIDEMIQRNAGS